MLQKGNEKSERAIQRAVLEMEQKAAREAAIVDHAAENYGPKPMNQSTEPTGIKRVQLAEITATDDGPR